MYKIVRHYFRATPNKRVINRGLTLEEAKAHCGSAEASSKSCTKPNLKAVTRRMGPWFDSFYKI